VTPRYTEGHALTRNSGGVPVKVPVMDPAVLYQDDLDRSDSVRSQPAQCQPGWSGGTSSRTVDSRKLKLHTKIRTESAVSTHMTPVHLLRGSEATYSGTGS